MKKPAVIILIAAAILLFPTLARANGPGPSPYNNYIAVQGYSQVVTINMHLSSNEGNESQLLDHPQDSRRKDEKIFFFYNDGNQYKMFRLQVTLNDGSVQVSDYVDFVEWGNYIYNVDTNVLVQGEITSWRISSLSVLFIPLFLGLPLLVTLLVEWGVSQAFRLKPGKYVVIANMVTNLAMNLLILFVYNRIMLDYYAILVFLELCAGGLEFLFYTLVYKAYTKKRLLLFTAVANIASWGVYYLLSFYMF